ncbi:hypothetical protein NQ318_023244 [Aromia moschata]|uniref:DNA-directed DNA polymerase n=1 Tax=Aromia moschata TaxID=1265417 RepID=A0AAV8XLY7_9CUCU|nr:hypothetical protein NQ318_023244 [Aromia moschata]
MVISEIQQKEFEISTNSHICEKPSKVDDTKIRDHCYLTGKYRGPAPEICNLNFKNSFTVPVINYLKLNYLIKNNFILFKLNGSDITDEDYEQAKTLDAAYYYTLPGFTWDCMLKYTKIELEFLQDVDMFLFIERGIRGGVSQCCNRYAKANNKFMSSYNTKEISNYLMYFDVNNHYGWAMSQALPIENFENFNVHSVPDDADEGYILEVDVEYPETLHNLHKDIPLFPEHHTPPKSKLSKLLTTLYNKTRYVLLINAVYGKCMENVRKHRIVKLVKKWEGRYGVKN